MRVIDRPPPRSRCMKHGLLGPVLLCSLLAACGSVAPGHAAKASYSPLERAPANIVALATTRAKATVAGVRLPSGAAPIAGSSRLLAPPTLRNGSAFAAFGDDDYVSVIDWQQKWRVPASAGLIVSDIAAGLGAGATRSEAMYVPSPGWAEQSKALLLEHPSLPALSAPPSSITYEEWELPTANAWFSRRDLMVVAASMPEGGAIVELAAQVVWIPERLRVPSSARAVTVSLTPSGKVLARISDERTVQAIARAVDAMRPDEARRGTYFCPLMFGVPSELHVAFVDAAHGTVAVLNTQWCPSDAKLWVPGYGSLLLSAGPAFIAQIERIVGVHIAVSGF
jgi:hypothetical protein